MTIAADTEATPITEDEPVPRLVVLSAAGPFGSVLFAQHDPSLPDFLVWLFSQPTTWANASFDVLVLIRRFPWLLPYVLDAYRNDRVRDVLTRDRLLCNATGEFAKKFGLEHVVERRLGLTVAKEDSPRLDFGRFLGVDVQDLPQAHREYALGDAVITLAADAVQEPHAWCFGTQYEQARAHLVLFATSIVGLRTDQQRVSEVDLRLRTEIGYAAQEIVKAGLGKWTFVTDTSRAAELVAETHRRAGGSAPLTKSGKVSLARAALTKHGNRALELYHRRGNLSNEEKQELVKAGIGRWKFKRDESAAKALLERDVPDCVRTEHKGPSLSKDALESASIPTGHPLDAFRRYGALQTQWTRNIPCLRHPVLRTRYVECIDTNRTASRIPRLYPGRQMQNQEREGGFRECLVPNPAPSIWIPEHQGGNDTFVTTDYGAIELVTHSQILLEWFGWSKLADMLNAGIDPHTKRGMSYVGAEYEAFDKKNREHKDARQLAKAENFGLPGGLGARKFVEYARTTYGVIITEDQARSSKRRWLADLPEMSLYFERIKSTFPGWVEIHRYDEKGPRYTVRLRGFVRADCTFPEACNFFFQCLAAMVAKRAGWLLFEATLDRQSPMYGCEQTMFVHDEWVTQCPRAHAEDVKAEQERLMLKAENEVCPLVRGKVETVISERYGK